VVDFNWYVTLLIPAPGLIDAYSNNYLMTRYSSSSTFVSMFSFACVFWWLYMMLKKKLILIDEHSTSIIDESRNSMRQCELNKNSVDLVFSEEESLSPNKFAAIFRTCSTWRDGFKLFMTILQKNPQHLSSFIYEILLSAHLQCSWPNSIKKKLIPYTMLNEFINLYGNDLQDYIFSSLVWKILFFKGIFIKNNIFQIPVVWGYSDL
jgi:hypothetical protein